MLTAGWLIFWGIILFIILLLALPVHAVVEWNEKLTVKVRYLFFKFTLIPGKEKKEKKKTEKKEKNEKPKENKPKKPKKKRTPEEAVDGFIAAVHRYGPGAKMILRNIRLHKLEGFWKIAAEDAAACAIRYGRICALLNAAFGLIRNLVKIEKTKLRVYPDFLAEKEEIWVNADIEANPLIMLIGGIRIAFALLGSMIKEQQKETSKKGAYINERKKS